MCKSKMTRSPFMGFVSAAALLGLLAARNPEAGLAQSCSPGMGGNIGVSGPYASPLDFYIHVGQSATIQQLATINTGSCTLTNVKAWLVYPDSSFQEILDLNSQASPNNVLPSLAAVSCPGDGKCVAFSATYQVKTNDVGNSLAFTTNWPPSFIFNVSAGGSPNTVQFQLAGSASAIRTGGGMAQEQPTSGLIVLQPGVNITKNCVGGPFLYGQPITFSGVIANTSVPQVTPSDGDLFILSVADNPATTITFATTTSSGRTYNGTLTAGESIVYSGSYVPQTNLCGPFSDTVQVIAADVTGFTVTNTASAVCSIITAPCISVTKNCPVQPIAYGTTSYPVSGVVSNCGNMPLVGVKVVDDNGTPGNLADDITINIGSLAVGGTAAYSATNTVPVGCGPFTDTVVATGNSQCGGTVSSTNNCTTQVTTAPAIAITLACPAVSASAGGLITYTGTVTNSGNVTLNKVIVVNSQPSPNIVFTVASLAPGASANFTASFTAPTDACSVSSTVTGSGSDNCTQALVSNSASATCPLITTPGIKVTKVCPAQPVFPGQLFTFSGSVSNTGNVTLTNIVVVNNQPALNTPVFTWPSLAPGAVANFTGSYTPPVNNCSVTDTLTATGRSICGVAVTNSASATCPIQTAPAIAVTLACPAVSASAGGLITYTGTVTNSGNVTLNKVIVVNSQPSPNIVFTVASLAPGASANFTASFTAPTDACSVSSMVTVAGSDTCTQFMVTNTASSPNCPLITAPGIKVTKSCLERPVSPDQLLTFSGSVSNTGNVTLTNIVVVNSQPAANTPVIGPITLAPGAGTNFTASYVAPTNCSVTDTLTATGRSICGVAVTNTVTATCPIPAPSAIVVTVSCPPNSVGQGGILTFSGTVRNAGNITLSNIIVVNNWPPGFSNIVIFTATSLAPGATTNFTGTYVVPLNCCEAWIWVKASGQGCDGVTVTDTDSGTCTVFTSPSIVVTKVCVPTMRRGLPVLLRPGYTNYYSGTVSNAGNIALYNVTVVDNQPINNTLVIGPIILAPGESQTYSGSYIVPPDSCGDDTVTALGFNLCGGALVTNSATATCPIAPYSPRIAVTKQCAPQPTPHGGTLTFSGTVSNLGNVTLVNVFVVNNQPSNNTPVIGPITLAPGEFLPFTGSYTPPLVCCVTMDTLTARGQDRCSGSNVTATAMAICPLLYTPGIALVQDCPPYPLPMGSVYVFSGFVTNTGDALLTNVVVFSSQAGQNLPLGAIDGQNLLLLGPIDLAPGESAPYTNSLTVPFNTCEVTVTVTSQETCAGTWITNTVSCPVVPEPLGLVIGTPTINTNGFFSLSFPTGNGKWYTVQYKNALTDPAWITLPGMPVSGTGGPLIIYDPTPAGQPSRFYRIMSLP